MSIGEQRRQSNGATTIEAPAPDLLSQVVEHTTAVRQGYSVRDMEVMAKKAAASRLFGMDENQAFTLMMIAESEGIHPIQALKRYHVFQGKPAMKSEAMLSDMLARGWIVEWLTETFDGTKQEAVFTHPKKCPKGKAVSFSWEDAENAKLSSKDNWKHYAPAMERARVVSIACRMLDPAVVVGMYTPEEIMDFDDEPKPAAFTSRPLADPEPVLTIERHDAPPVDYGSTKEPARTSISPMMAWLDPFLAGFNDRWRNVLLIESKADAYKPLANPFQVGNHLISEWIKTGALDEDEILTDGKRDKLKVKQAFYTAWRQDEEEIKAEVQEYLNGKLKAAAEAAGVELAEEEHGDAWEPPVEGGKE